MSKRPIKIEWNVYSLKRKAKWIGRVEAIDEKEALRKAQELDVPAAEKFRLSVQRD